jgi:sarcosine oxidase
MPNSYDVAVLGLGAMGSATAYSLARRGRRVLAIDRWSPPHALGSTHGRTRIIREAYFEHPLYVPLVQRAYELWAELEKAAGERLLQQTGGLMIGPADGVLVAGARRSAEEHAIPHEVLTAGEVRRRFPAYRPPDDAVALHEPRAGLLLPEACIGAWLDLARRHGAELRLDEPVERWRAEGDGVVVTTARGTYQADRLVLAAGPWMPELLPDLQLPLTVERQLFHWFQPSGAPADFGPERCPIALWEYDTDRIFATFTDLGDGIKCGVHHEGEITTPEGVRRTVSEEETAETRALLARIMPAAPGRLRDRAVCLYTNTPDQDFLVDVHPAHPQVVIASPCSGHGFKFASVLGEVIADLATGATEAFDLAPFRLARPSMRLDTLTDAGAAAVARQEG